MDGLEISLPGQEFASVLPPELLWFLNRLGVERLVLVESWTNISINRAWFSSLQSDIPLK